MFDGYSLRDKLTMWGDILSFAETETGSRLVDELKMQIYQNQDLVGRRVLSAAPDRDRLEKLVDESIEMSGINKSLTRLIDILSPTSIKIVIENLSNNNEEI